MPNKKRFILLDCDDTTHLTEEVALTACHGVFCEDLRLRAKVMTIELADWLHRFPGKTCALIAAEVATMHGFTYGNELEALVLRERQEVIRALRAGVKTTPGLIQFLARIETSLGIAMVSSSHPDRLFACIDGTDLRRWFLTENVFSVQQPGAEVAPKPSGEIYRRALTSLKIQAEEALAVEDSRAGVCAAVEAGIPVVGFLAAVPQERREDHGQMLRDNGAFAIATTWDEVYDQLQI